MNPSSPTSALKHRADFLLVQEGGLDIDLRELGLAVGAQVENIRYTGR